MAAAALLRPDALALRLGVAVRGHAHARERGGERGGVRRRRRVRRGRRLGSLLAVGSADVGGGQRAGADAQQRVFRPAGEPVDGARVDQRREGAHGRLERGAGGAHRQHNVQVLAHARGERGEARVAPGAAAGRLDDRPQLGGDALLRLGVE